MYTNISLISNQYFTHRKVSNKICESFLIKKHLLDARILEALNLRTYLNTVTGKITEIRRKEQVIILNDEVSISYDLLFLMTGEIFQNPIRQNRTIFQHQPENVYIINTETDASIALKKFKSLTASPYCKFIKRFTFFPFHNVNC